MSNVSRYLDPALVEHLNHLQLSARTVVMGSTTGQHKSLIKGASVEFRQHRFYVPGDELRRLDWRVLGRTDRPYVKEYDEETNLRCMLMLDCSGSMAYGRTDATKFDYAARLSAAMAYLMLGQTESVGLALCGQKVEEWLAAHAGPTQLARVVEMLDRTTPRGPSALAKAIHDVADRMGRRALVMILSDFFMPVEEIRGGLAHLCHNRHEVIAIQIVHRDEEQFPFRKWTQFRGLEGEAGQLCEPSIVRSIYLDNFRRQRRMLQEVCMALRVEWQPLTTEKPVLEAIRLLMHRRAK